MKINSLIEHHIKFAKDFSKQKKASFSHYKQSKVYTHYFYSVGIFILLGIGAIISGGFPPSTLNNIASLMLLLFLIANALYIKKNDQKLDILMVQYVQERQNESYKMYFELLKNEYKIRCSNELQTLSNLIKEDTMKKYPPHSINFALFSFILALLVAGFNFSSSENKSIWFIYSLSLLIFIFVIHYVYKRVKDVLKYSNRKLRFELCKILDEIHLTLLIQENNQDRPSPNAVKSFSKTIKTAKRYRHF